MALKKKRKQTKQTFSVKTSYGTVEKVPVIAWKELVPYWEDICKAVFEVLIENDFQPYTATLKRPSGYVASSFYWNISMRSPAQFPLSEARYFIYKLQEKSSFTNSIREFNKKSQKNWLEDSNIAILGGYVYSFCLFLRPVLDIVKKGQGESLKPRIKGKGEAR